MKNRVAYYNVFKRGINIIIEGGANWKEGSRRMILLRYMTNRMCSFGQFIGVLVSQMETISKEFNKKDLTDEVQKTNDFLGM